MAMEQAEGEVSDILSLQAQATVFAMTSSLVLITPPVWTTTVGTPTPVSVSSGLQDLTALSVSIIQK